MDRFPWGGEPHDFKCSRLWVTVLGIMFVLLFANIKEESWWGKTKTVVICRYTSSFLVR